MADADGTKHHDSVGFLPPKQFMAQLELGMAKTDLNKGNYQKAASRLRTIAARYPDDATAPQALYWLGVSEYKRTGSAKSLKAVWRELMEKYPDSIWATKVSFINGK